MATFNLRRFSKPEMLRRIDRKHLIAFLEPHAAYFSARGVELPPVQQEDGLDYNALSHLLLTPDSTTPDDLAEALFYVNEVVRINQYTSSRNGTDAPLYATLLLAQNFALMTNAMRCQLPPS